MLHFQNSPKKQQDVFLTIAAHNNDSKNHKPQTPKDNRKRVAKRVTVDLVDEDEEEEELIRKWTMITGDCQKFNAIYKHIERKSGENKAHHIEAAKVIFAAQQPKGIKRKLQVGTSAYEEKKQKELAMMEFKEMEFLMIDADQLPEPKARIIRRRQEKIIAKYAQE
ncbi:hypothetical protein Tco_1346550 [Tanacetum coccineum]